MSSPKWVKEVQIFVDWERLFGENLGSLGEFFQGSHISPLYLALFFVGLRRASSPFRTLTISRHKFFATAGGSNYVADQASADRFDRLRL